MHYFGAVFRRRGSLHSTMILESFCYILQRFGRRCAAFCNDLGVALLHSATIWGSFSLHSATIWGVGARVGIGARAGITRARDLVLIL